MNINDLYKELIIDHGTNPRNFCELNNATAQAEVYNPLCGDKIILFLKLKENIIVNATFQGHGCAISTASASILTEVLIGKSKTQAINIFNNFIKAIVATEPAEQASLSTIELPEQLTALIGIKNYPSRVKCATLAWHALQAVLNKQDQ